MVKETHHSFFLSVIISCLFLRQVFLEMGSLWIHSASEEKTPIN